MGRNGPVNWRLEFDSSSVQWLIILLCIFQHRINFEGNTRERISHAKTGVMCVNIYSESSCDKDGRITNVNVSKIIIVPTLHLSQCVYRSWNFSSVYEQHIKLKSSCDLSSLSLFAHPRQSIVEMSQICMFLNDLCTDHDCVRRLYKSKCYLRIETRKAITMLYVAYSSLFYLLLPS